MPMKYTGKSFLFSILFFISLLSFGQDLNYARQVVDTLSSSYMGGRGYVDSGQFKAAKYISSQFKKHGLKSFEEGSYLQSFNHPINTLPGRLQVKIDGVELEPGVDYLVNSSSGSLMGTFSLVWYDKENIPERKHFNKLVRRNFFKEKVVVIDERGVEDEAKKELFEEIKYNIFGAPAIIKIQDDKLTWGPSLKYNDFVTLEILRGVFDRSAKEIFIDIENRFIPNFKSDNVIGYIEGSLYPDSFVVFTGHYDHLGYMGDSVYFPGANDNASGIAMLLNLSKYFSQNPPSYSIAIMAFGAEEAGLLGSSFYTENPLFPLDKISFLWNFDILGTGGEGIKVVNGKVFKKRFEKLASINEKENYLSKVSPRGAAAISDHHFFYKKGVPCFYSYTLGGTKAYHDVYDKAETLPLTEFEDVFRLVRDYILEVTISD